MVAKTKAISRNKEGEPLFYIANREKFKAAKINLLTAKSSVLMSRNFSVRYLDAIEKEELAKQDIKKTLNRIALLLKRIKSNLPNITRPNIEKVKKKNVQHRAIVTKGDTGVSEKTEIDLELDSINQKLKELAGL